MALTKVSGHIIDQPFDVGIITATNSYVSGIGTFGNIRVLGDLQVDGTTTTLDTVVTEVDRLEVSANNSTVGLAVTQSGSGDILNLYDGATEVFSVADGGNVSIVDKIVHTGDTNTAIRFPAADTFTVETAGSEALRVDASQRLLMGTSSTIGAGNDIIMLKGTSVSDASIYCGRNANASSISNGNNLGFIKFGGGDGGLAARIGGVADGTWSSTSDCPGRIEFSTTADGASTPTERLRIDSSGRLLLGTTNAGSNGTADDLVVANNASVNDQAGITIRGGTSGRSQIFFSDGTSGGDEYRGMLRYDHSEDSMQFRTAGTERLRIDSSGAATFAGAINGNVTGNISGGTVAGSTGTFTNEINTAGNSASLVINRTIGGSANIIKVQNSGSDVFRVENDGSATFAGNVNIADKIVHTGDTNTSIRFPAADTFTVETAGTERLRVTSGGIVRIPDNGKFTAGAGDDLQIYHDSTDNIIKSATAALKIHAAGSNSYTVHVSARPDKETIICYNNTNAPYVELYYNNSKKLETTTTGVTVTGSLTQTTEYPSIRPILDLNFAATKTLDRRITFRRGSLGTFIGEDGLVKYASNNVPRFDHDPTTGESLGLLIEESRTNLVEYGDFTTGWTEYGGTATSTTATTAPDGTFTAKKITSKGDQSTAGIYDSIQYSANTTYTHTTWLKAGTVTIAGITVNSGGKWASSNYPYITVNLSTGAVTASGGVSAKATAYPNGWYKLEATGTFAGNTQVDAIWVHSQTGSSMSGDTSSYYYAWGPQAEQGTFATSYIPTSGTAVTRAADTATIKGTNFSSWYNKNEGTVYSQFKNIPFGGGMYYFGPGGSPRWYTRYELTNGISTQAWDGSGGSGLVNIVVPGVSNNETIADLKHVLSIDNISQQHVGSANGSAVVTGTWDDISDVSTLTLGRRVDTNSYLNGHISCFKYYNKRLPNAQLQGLTQQ